MTVRTAWRRLGENPVFRAVRVPLGTLVAVAALVALANLLGMQTPPYVVALGALVGVSYGLIGVCTSLIFRVSGVINLALPATGIFALSFMPMLVDVLHFPWWLAFLAILPIGFVTGALTEVVVVRRLADAPRVVGIIASLGVAGVLASGAAFARTLLPGGYTQPLPQPPGIPQFSIGPLVVSPGYTALIVAAPVMTVALAIFLTRTRLGLAVRASASNPDNARLSAISPGLVSAGAWAIAGLVSTVTIVFFLGNVPADPTASVLSPDLLLPGLAAAAIAGFTNLPRALAGGIVLGIVQQVMLWDAAWARYSDLAMMVVLALAMLVSRRARGRAESTASWNTVSNWRPLPADLQRLWPIRHLGAIVLVLAVGAVVWAGTRSDVAAQTWTSTVILAVIALTAALITGLAGTLSLGQVGFALLSGGASYVVVAQTGSFFMGVLAAAVVGGVATAVVAYPTLRSRGLGLPILTLGIAIAIPSAFLMSPAVFGSGTVAPGQPVIGSVAITIGVPYFLFTMVVAAVCAFVGWNVWRGGLGRMVRASRDNESAAEAFGIPIARRRMAVMVVSGVLAGVMGAVLVHSFPSISAGSVPVDYNVRIVLAVVVGGVGVYFGGPLGVLWVFGSGVAQAASSTSGPAQSAALAIYGSALILILVAPGGAAALLRPVRDFLAVGIGRLFGVRHRMGDLRGELRLNAAAPEEPRIAVEAEAATEAALHTTEAPHAVAAPGSLRAVAHPPVPQGASLLECRDLHLAYGGVPAVAGLNFTLEPGEMLGLIGPNGAGKTSTFELITGFAKPTSGSILFAGDDITRLPAHRRAQRGLVRSFQDARLFSTMTAVEVVELALERQLRTSVPASILGVDLTVRRRRSAAEDVIDFFGLTPYRGARISELSTGTRRFVELAALISMRPRVLLLDEPSSGIAQRESEALGPLLRNLRDEFDLSMIVIEHDVPLIMSISDRVLVMDRGRELALGAPEDVRADPRVVDAYMGGALEAVERSDQPPTGSTPRAATTGTPTPRTNDDTHPNATPEGVIHR